MNLKNGMRSYLLALRFCRLLAARSGQIGVKWPRIGLTNFLIEKSIMSLEKCRNNAGIQSGSLYFGAKHHNHTLRKCVPSHTSCMSFSHTPRTNRVPPNSELSGALPRFSAFSGGQGIFNDSRLGRKPPLGLLFRVSGV